MSNVAWRVLVARASFPSLDPERRILGAIGAEVIDGRWMSSDQLAVLCRSVDALMTDYFPVPRALIEQMERCRVICQYGVGLDQIDLAAATERRILVTHTPDYCTEEVADHALALLLCLWRKILPLHQSVQAGDWDYNRADLVLRIRGRTLGLVGLGRVARNLAAKARVLGFKVIACDPGVDRTVAAELDVELGGLEELLERADAISLHVPLGPATHHLIGAAELGRMKPTAILINTARGALVHQAALTRALVDGRLAGAGLDVLETEPPAKDDPLLRLPNVIVTPHAAFYSRESLAAVQTQAAEAVAALLTSRMPPVLANPEVILARGG